MGGSRGRRKTARSIRGRMPARLVRISRRGLPAGRLYTTGVIRRNQGTSVLALTAVNLGRVSRRVSFEVYRWDTGAPDRIHEQEPVALNAQSSRSFQVDLAAVGNPQLYEVRLFITGAQSVVVNVFGTNAFLTPQTGNTVLQHQLIRLV